MEWGVVVFFVLAILLIMNRRKFNKAVTPALEKVGEAGDKLHDAIDEGVEVIGDKLEEARDVVRDEVNEVIARVKNDEK